MMEHEQTIREQQQAIIQATEGFAERPLFTAEGAMREIKRLDELKPKEPNAK